MNHIVIDLPSPPSPLSHNHPSPLIPAAHIHLAGGESPASHTSPSPESSSADPPSVHGFTDNTRPTQDHPLRHRHSTAANNILQVLADPQIESRLRACVREELNKLAEIVHEKEAGLDWFPLTFVVIFSVLMFIGVMLCKLFFVHVLGVNVV
ncbi:hypothetical protein ACOSQ2_000450 [Xanthoceras sorbifolium]